MKYNFDEIIDRRGTDCLKYDFGQKRMGRDDLLPMWIADMDFRLPEVILAELHKRVDHGIFGYTDPLDDYYAALNRWYSARYGFTVEPEWVTLAAGLVYAIHVSVRAFTAPGDAVMVMQPVYRPFCEAIRSNGRRLVNCRLLYEDGRYAIDFAGMERMFREEAVKALIFCSPHNPVGRVWTEAELTRVAALCQAYGVLLMVDEIHCDFVFPGRSFFSCMRLEEEYRGKLVFFSSPGKTFNIAGLQSATVVIPDRALRESYREANRVSGYSQGNAMGQAALIACYNLGADWVDELVSYIYGNVQYAEAFIKENLPKAKVVDPEGTYLLWVDFSGYGITPEELERRIVDKAKLWLDEGSIFGPESALFERINLAAPRAVVEEAMGRLKEAFADLN